MPQNGYMGIMRKDSEINDLEEAFDVDGMLGHLAKWLRILGFDAEYPCKSPSEDRYFVTTNKKVRDPRAIVVTAGEPMKQLREVLEAAQIIPSADFFLSRCLICNIPVKDISRDEVLGQVPVKIGEKVLSFRQCARCGRIFWEGSHSDRIKIKLKAGEVIF
jgi:uncharacterized protein